MPWKSIPTEYKGVKYSSMNRLYKAMREHLHKYAHREPSTSYIGFLEAYRKNDESVEAAVKCLTAKKKPKPETDLKAESRRLAGADNLVCQRMTKLGWSYEKAISTPLNTSHLPIRVKYKGRVYPSIAACWRAVQPGMSIPKFTIMLREKGCIK